jgi:uncharacterized damage-inducible protein DinB
MLGRNTGLRELFVYDLWANQRWLAVVAALDVDAPERGIMAHLLSGQSIWASRVEGASLSSMPAAPLTEEFLTALNERWLTLVDTHGHDPLIVSRNTDGTERRFTFTQIAMHVINHGTYHRGEMRGLFKARDDHEFPETDLARFYAEQASGV